MPAGRSGGPAKAKRAKPQARRLAAPPQVPSSPSKDLPARANNTEQQAVQQQPAASEDQQMTRAACEAITKLNTRQNLLLVAAAVGHRLEEMGWYDESEVMSRLRYGKARHCSDYSVEDMMCAAFNHGQQEDDSQPAEACCAG
eukprot:gene8991-9163_t